MIFYLTKETVERYHLDMTRLMSAPEAQALIEAEHGDRLLEWGVKLFYYNRRKCLQIANFASKLI